MSRLAFEAWETRVFLSPRRQIARAPAEWFALQRGWWSGTADPGKPIPRCQSRLSLDLTDDWACKILGDGLTGAPPEDVSLIAPKLDDSSWPRMRIGIFNIPDHTDAHHILFRRSFTVPRSWNQGRVLLFTHSDVMGKWRRYLDGKPLQARASDDDLGGLLKPGSTHNLAIEIWGQEMPAGTPVPIFLSYRPDPISRQHIKDHWSYARDRLTYSPASDLPLATSAEGAVRTMVNIDQRQSACNIVLHVQAPVDGVIFNGHWLAGFPNIYDYVDLNVTPWVRFGRANELIAVFHDKLTIRDAWLDCYDKGVYP